MFAVLMNSGEIVEVTGWTDDGEIYFEKNGRTFWVWKEEVVLLNDDLRDYNFIDEEGEWE